jgi:hypothetical protein
LENGHHILIADTPTEFARATLQLLDDCDLADKLSRNGRKQAETTYDYRIAYRPLDQVYTKI